MKKDEVITDNQININIDAYFKRAEKCIEEGDLIKAISLYRSAYNLNRYNFQVIFDMARLYADMGLYELSNKFLYSYMDKSPSSFISKAYEELAINYFYLDNHWASGYYFHKKLQEDGFINTESLDEEIAEFLKDINDKKEAYFVAYPFERADYSYRIKSGRRALGAGQYATASLIYSSIPPECRNEEVAGDYAVSCFLSGMDEEMKKACKESLRLHGENVTAYCNLSNYYRDKGDLEKSKYYFNKALSVRKGKEDEPYKIAACSVELGEDEISNECLIKILKDRPYDEVMNFFCGISYLNLGNYEEGLKYIKRAYIINPDDLVYKYYAKFAQNLVDNEGLGGEELPLKYLKDLPEKLTNRYKRVIRSTVKGCPPKKLKEEELSEILEWGINTLSEGIQRDCVIIAGLLKGKKGQDFLKRTLLSLTVRDNIKKLALITLINLGCKDKISIVIRSYFVKVKPRKTLFSGTEDEGLFLPAYSLALATSVFAGIEEYEKIGFSVNKLYKKYQEEIKSKELTTEEISALIICTAEIEKIKENKDICKYFSVELSRIKDLIEIIKGDKNDD